MVNRHTNPPPAASIAAACKMPGNFRNANIFDNFQPIRENIARCTELVKQSAHIPVEQQSTCIIEITDREHR